MEDVTLTLAVCGPTIGECGEKFAVRIELRETVEQQRHHFARRHIGGERGVERARVVRLVIDESPRLADACLTMAGREKTEEQGAPRGVEKVDSTVQVSQHSRDW